MPDIFEKSKKANENDVEGFKDIFTRMADVAEKYKRAHGIKRL